MEPISVVLGLVVGLLLGAVTIAWWASLARGRVMREASALEVRLEERARRGEELEQELQNHAKRLEVSHSEGDQLRQREATLTAQLEGERKAMREKLELLEKAEKILRDSFSALSAEALRRNNQSFLELAKTSLGQHQKTAAHDLEKRQKAIDDLVKPIRESMQKVDQKLAETEKERVASHRALTEHVKNLTVTHQKLQAETGKLVTALRSPTVRGRWGEIQLKRVVELAGMLEHCDFYEQESVNTDSGRLRPDLVVRLPGGKNIVIDAKAPLSEYLEAIETSDEHTAKEKRIGHSRQVREHMTALSQKTYWEQFQPTPEFVVMFLPGEMFFSAALEHDPSLIEFGVGKGVIPASPTTLIALLRSVAYGWRQEKIAENAQKVSDLGADLYKRVRTMASYFEELRRGLEKAVDSYNKAVASIETRVLVSTRKFKDLGADSGEDVPHVLGIDKTPRSIQAPELLVDMESVSDSSTQQN
jgi:DNA recombination protein RmuC